MQSPYRHKPPRITQRRTAGRSRLTDFIPAPPVLLDTSCRAFACKTGCLTICIPGTQPRPCSHRTDTNHSTVGTGPPNHRTGPPQVQQHPAAAAQVVKAKQLTDYVYPWYKNSPVQSPHCTVQSSPDYSTVGKTSPDHSTVSRARLPRQTVGRGGAFSQRCIQRCAKVNSLSLQGQLTFGDHCQLSGLVIITQPPGRARLTAERAPLRCSSSRRRRRRLRPRRWRRRATRGELPQPETPLDHAPYIYTYTSPTHTHTHTHNLNPRP
jgi:hypothetical protein